MNIHYKIVEVWPQDHLIVARYWTDVLTEEFLASDSNRYENGTPVRCRTDVSMSISIPPPSEKELEEMIFKAAPLKFLETLEAVQDPNTDTSMADILTLKNKKYYTENVNDRLKQMADTIKSELSDEEIQTLINTVSNK
jgi:hypothetical protein